jgi:hypothetical protein
MAQTKTSKASKPAPKLGELLSATQSELDATEVAKKALQEQLAQMEQNEAALKAERDAKLAEVLTPYRAKRDEQLQLIANAKSEMAEAIAKATAEARAPFDAIIEQAEATLADNEQACEENEEIPAAVLNMDIKVVAAPKSSTSASKSTTGTQPSLRALAEAGMVGMIVTITAPNRKADLDPSKPVTVMYKVAEGTDGYVLCSRRIDKDYGEVILQDEVEKALKDEWYHVGTPTFAASHSGWHSVADVKFALASAAGIVSKYPTFTPASDPSNIYVDGDPLTSSKVEEVTIKETV